MQCHIVAERSQFVLVSTSLQLHVNTTDPVKVLWQYVEKLRRYDQLLLLLHSSVNPPSQLFDGDTGTRLSKLDRAVKQLQEVQIPDVADEDLSAWTNAI